MAANTLTFDTVTSTSLTATTVAVTFSSIPATWTDLVLVVQGTWTSSNTQDIYLQFNGDTGSNYQTGRTLAVTSTSVVFPDGNLTSTVINCGLLSSNAASMSIWHILNYSATNTGKPVHGRSTTPEYNSFGTGCWRSTSAITSIKIYNSTSLNFTTGTVFSLYGILKA